MQTCVYPVKNSNDLNKIWSLKFDLIVLIY